MARHKDCAFTNTRLIAELQEEDVDEETHPSRKTGCLISGSRNGPWRDSDLSYSRTCASGSRPNLSRMHPMVSGAVNVKATSFLFGRKHTHQPY